MPRNHIINRTRWLGFTKWVDRWNVSLGNIEKFVEAVSDSVTKVTFSCNLSSERTCILVELNELRVHRRRLRVDIAYPMNLQTYEWLGNLKRRFNVISINYGAENSGKFVVTEIPENRTPDYEYL